MQTILTWMVRWGSNAFGGFQREWLCNALAGISDRALLNDAVRVFAVSRALKSGLVTLIKTESDYQRVIRTAIWHDPHLENARESELTGSIAKVKTFLQHRGASIATDQELIRAMIAKATEGNPTIANTVWHALTVMPEPFLMIEANRIVELSLFLRKHGSSIHEWESMNSDARMTWMKRYPEKFIS